MVPDSPTSAENVVLLGPPWVVEKKLSCGGGRHVRSKFKHDFFLNRELY